ncbi:MAG: C69 family dipeptidase, partial [Burkholderiales bacterium]|nr:C69 family dipeptidase [Anaerolineae bacterium]
MCDSFVALPPATINKTTIFAKSADCQINEAHALVHYPRRSHIPGEALRATHRVIPQAAETYEVIMSKSFWTWGAEIGVNEYGVSIGNEAVFTTLQKQETAEGLMVIDMLRIGLERGKSARAAVDAIVAVLEAFGQGGNCELTGNSHFDGSYLITDPNEAWILETAGRQWAARKLTDSVGSISNVLSIDKWDISSLTERHNWANSYTEEDIVPKIGSRERQACAYNGLAASRGNVSVKTFFNVLRQHDDGYDPATAPAHTNICLHAGPSEYRQWQACGAMVTEVGEQGIIAWATATSGNCVSIFKPLFLGIELPDTGPYPTEHYDPRSLWWKHELLHRRAMAGFDDVVPEIRRDFDALEDEFLAAAPSLMNGTAQEKKAFVEDCFRKAESATQAWIERLCADP